MQNDCVFYEVKGKTTKYGFCLILLEPIYCEGAVERCMCDKERRKESKAYYNDWKDECDKENT